VLETLGSVGSNQPQLRHKGFTERMKEKYPDIEVHSLTIESVADNVNKMMLQALTKNPNILGVFSDNDRIVPGVLSALRRIGKLVPVGQQGHVAIVGMNGTPGALDRIRKGSLEPPGTPIRKAQNIVITARASGRAIRPAGPAWSQS